MIEESDFSERVSGRLRALVISITTSIRPSTKSIYHCSIANMSYVAHWTPCIVEPLLRLLLTNCVETHFYQNDHPYSHYDDVWVTQREHYQSHKYWADQPRENCDDWFHIIIKADSNTAAIEILFYLNIIQGNLDCQLKTFLISAILLNILYRGCLCSTYEKLLSKCLFPIFRLRPFAFSP